VCVCVLGGAVGWRAGLVCEGVLLCVIPVHPPLSRLLCLSLPVSLSLCVCACVFVC